MRIVIFTPVLNGADFIAAAMASVTDQTFTGWRHVILDGGSEDGTLQIVRARAEGDPRVVWASAPDAGMYDALMAGFARESGDVFAWLNADDLYPPWALAEIARVFSAEPETDWVAGLPGLWDGEGRLRAVAPAGWHPQGLTARGWFHDGCLGSIQQESVFFRSRLLDRLSEEEKRRIASLRLAGDHALWRGFARHARLRTVPTVLGGFRVHSRNMSRLKADAYGREVRGLGSPIPPRWMIRPLRSIADLVSAYAALRLQRAAARDLHRQGSVS